MGLQTYGINLNQMVWNCTSKHFSAEKKPQCHCQTDLLSFVSIDKTIWCRSNIQNWIIINIANV